MSGMADSVVARLIKQRDLMQAMDEQCRSILVRVTSRDQSVSVEVDGVGAMTGLWLNQNAYRNGPDELAKLIVETADAAARLVMERQQYLSSEFEARIRELGEQPLARWDDSRLPPS